MRKKKVRIPKLEHLVTSDRKMRMATYNQGARLYGMSKERFVELAKESKANLIIKKQAVVDLDKFEAYLSKFMK